MANSRNSAANVEKSIGLTDSEWDTFRDLVQGSSASAQDIVGEWLSEQGWGASAHPRPKGITRNEAILLRYLASMGSPCTRRQIADETSLLETSLARIVPRLEKARLVESTRLPAS